MGSAPVDLGANPGTNTSARNFAWGASTTGTGYKDLGPSGVAGQVANLQTQVADYVSMMNNGILPTPSNALITLWSGANDAIYWVKGGNRTTEGMQATAAAATNPFSPSYPPAAGALCSSARFTETERSRATFLLSHY